jgi:hypothetical protein
LYSGSQHTVPYLAEEAELRATDVPVGDAP